MYNSTISIWENDENDSDSEQFFDRVEVVNLADTIPFLHEEDDNFNHVEEMEEHLFSDECW